MVQFIMLWNYKYIVYLELSGEKVLTKLQPFKESNSLYKMRSSPVSSPCYPKIGRILIRLIQYKWTSRSYANIHG